MELVLRPDAQESAHLARWNIDILVAQYEGMIYLPLSPICQAMGLASNGQIRRIREHVVMSKHFRRFYLGKDGRGANAQATACISERILGFWLGTISVSHVREEVREFILEFQEELVVAAHVALKQYLQRAAPRFTDSEAAMRAQLLRLERTQAEALAFYFAVEQRVSDIEAELFKPEDSD